MSSTLRELFCMQLLPVMFRDRWMRRSGLLTYDAALDWNGLAVGVDWEWTGSGLALDWFSTGWPRKQGSAAARMSVLAVDAIQESHRAVSIGHSRALL